MGVDLFYGTRTDTEKYTRRTILLLRQDTTRLVSINHDSYVSALQDRLKAAKRMTFLHVSADGAVALEAGGAAAWKEQDVAGACSHSSDVEFVASTRNGAERLPKKQHHPLAKLWLMPII